MKKEDLEGLIRKSSLAKRSKFHLLSICPESEAERELVAMIQDFATILIDKIEIDEGKVGKVIDLYNDDDCPIDGSKVSWKEYRKHFAQAIAQAKGIIKIKEE